MRGLIELLRVLKKRYVSNFRIGTSQGSPTRSPKRSKATDIVEKKQNVNLDDEEEEEEEEDDFE